MAGIQNNVVFSQGEKLEPSTPSDITGMQTTATDVSRANFAGDPNGNVAANPSSLCHDTTTGRIYRKATGTGNTGWVQIDSESTSPPIGSLAYFANADGETYITDAGWLKLDGAIYNDVDYPILASRIGKINPPGTNWLTGGSFSGASVITFDGSQFVVGSTSGGVGTSTNALVWTLKPSPLSTTISSIVFGGSIYVIGSSVGQIATSTDLLTFTIKAPSLGNPSTGIGLGPYMIYDGSKYVGTNGRTLMTSTDAITWNTIPTTPIANNLSYNCILFANSIYILTTTNGRVYTSTDLVTFTQSSTGTQTGIGKVIFAGGIYVANTTSATQGIITSTDAITWTARTVTNSFGLAYNGSLYVAALAAGSVSSTDAITWTARTNANNLKTIAFGLSVFVAAGSAGALRSSTDGITWDVRTSGTASIIDQVAFLNGAFIYTGVGGVIGTSTDGITWTPRTSGVTYELKTVTFNSVYYAGGDNGMITSTDAITWTTITSYSGTTSSISTLAYGASTYVLGSQGGLIATSTDAHTWTPRTSLTTSTVNTMTFGTVFVYADSAGSIASSTDAITWVTRTASGLTAASGLKYLNSIYIVGGSNGTTTNIFTSTDAITWTSRNSGTTTASKTFEYSNGYYNAQGLNFGIQSPDLVTWSPVVFPTLTPASSAQGNGNLVVAGNASIAYSTDAFPYNQSTQFQLPTDNNLLITVESATNFKRGLYIKALLP